MQNNLRVFVESLLKHGGPGKHAVSGSPQTAHNPHKTKSQATPIGKINAVAQGKLPKSKLKSTKPSLATQPSKEENSIEKSLASGILSNKKIGVKSVNKVSLIKTKDGKTLVKKELSGKSGNSEQELENEIIAKKLGDKLGANVPDISVDKAKNSITSAFVDNAKNGWQANDKVNRLYENRDILEPIAALDFLTNQQDRHGQNFLVKSDEDKIFLIDNGNTQNPKAMQQTDVYLKGVFNAPNMGKPQNKQVLSAIKDIVNDKTLPVQVRARAKFLSDYGFPKDGESYSPEEKKLILKIESSLK